jgi:tetratricopeptide (TPR) repeat protein
MIQILTPANADSLFDSSGRQTEQMTALANHSLNAGIDKYTREDYKGAALEFKRAFGLSPYSDNAADAVKYLAMSHQRLGQPDQAIAAYRLGLQMHPHRDDLQLALGHLCFGQGRTAEAVAAYESAVRLYDNENNRFALGQGYLKAGRHDDAVRQFKQVIQRAPASPNGYFGLGQVYASQKRYGEAVSQFERAVQKDRKFYAGYVEMGYACADKGDWVKAEEIRSFLEHNAKGLAETLGAHIRKKKPPKMMFAWPTSTFAYYLPPKTKVAALSDYLVNANAGQSFSMLLQFNKPMDRASIENPANWTIQRSTASGMGMQYNFGLPVADTETRISPIPISVHYDENRNTALIRFNIYQNASADATIDPSRLEFAFSGIDADGNAMHPKYDQFMGFSGIF